MFELIKNNRDQQPRIQRWIDIVLTTILWGSWLLLWLPLIPLAGWMLGHDLSEYGLPIEEGPAFLKDLKQFFINVAYIGSGLILWSSTALFISRWKEPRKAPFPVTRIQQARRYAVPVDQLAIWQKRSVVKISFKADGAIDYVETDLPVIPEPQKSPQISSKERLAAKRRRREKNKQALKAQLQASVNDKQIIFPAYHDDLEEHKQNDDDYHPWLVENLQ